MANFPIDENQEALELELRKIETSDPVHADIYNALYQKLINNDAFLERLADKMIRQAMISHVLDSNNVEMVLGADVGPKITAIMDELQRTLAVLNTKIDNFGEGIKIRYGRATVSFNSASGTLTHNLNFTSADSYILLAALNDSSIFGITGSIINRSKDTTYIQMHFVYNNTLSAANGNRQIAYIAIGK